MKRVSVAAFVLAAASVTFAGAARPVNDPLDGLLRAALDAPSTVSYAGTVEVVRLGSHAADVSVYRIEHRAPNLTRRDYTAPSSLAGDSMVTNGTLEYSIDPKRHRIVERRDDEFADSGAFQAEYGLLRANYRVTQTGSETYDGRNVIDLAFVSRYTHRTTTRMRLDAVSKVVLDKQEFSADGGLLAETRFEAIRYAPASAGDFALPSGYAMQRRGALATLEPPQRIARDAGFTMHEPRSLPEGFAPIEGTVVELHGVRTAHLLYCDGLRTVSLFENAQASTLEAATLRPRTMRVGAYEAEMPRTGRPRCSRGATAACIIRWSARWDRSTCRTSPPR